MQREGWLAARVQQLHMSWSMWLMVRFVFYVKFGCVYTYAHQYINSCSACVHAVQLTIRFHGWFESIHFDAESKFSVHSVVLINFVEIRRLVKILGSIHLCLVTCNTFSVADSAETKSLLGIYFCGVHITGALSCFLPWVMSYCIWCSV